MFIAMRNSVLIKLACHLIFLKNDGNKNFMVFDVPVLFIVDIIMDPWPAPGAVKKRQFNYSCHMNNMAGGLTCQD
jgi:hypothetical protein